MNVRHFQFQNQRSNQQDRFLIRSPVFAVADGMGGHAEGEIAAQLAVDTLGSFPTSIDLSAQIREAHRRIQAPNQRGTTLTAVKIREGNLHWAHVGDSRLWLVRSGMALQLTQDHSIGGIALEKGSVSLDQFDRGECHPGILNFCGMPGSPLIETGLITLRPGDRVVLTTDGFHTARFRYDLPTLLSASFPEWEKYAIAGGSTDNATVVIVER